MSNSNNKKDKKNKQYQKLIIKISKRYPDVTDKIRDGIKKQLFTKRQIVDYFTNCIKLYEISIKETSIYEYIADNLQDVARSLNYHEYSTDERNVDNEEDCVIDDNNGNMDDDATIDETETVVVCDSIIWEIISYLYNIGYVQRDEDLHEPNSPILLPQNTRYGHTELSNETTVAMIDGTQLTSNEITFEEFCIRNFDENAWLTKNGLIF
jgi:hypothetical protein